jgi:hypothetical protein
VTAFADLIHPAADFDQQVAVLRRKEGLRSWVLDQAHRSVPTSVIEAPQANVSWQHHSIG